MAPNRFAAIIPETCPFVESKVENTIPENKSGQVRIMAVSRRPMGVDENPPDLETHQPIASVAHKNTYGTRGLLILSQSTMEFPRKAMIRMPAITTPMTC